MSVRYLKSILAVISIIGLTVAYSGVVMAADDSDSIRKEFNQVFAKMLDDPADLDVTMRYAELAVKLKDYEAAIPALERVLLFNPELNKVKLDLGVLYYLLDSYDVAKQYFTDAKNGKNASPDIIESAEKYLKKIDEKV